jgi:hypothetical protein
MKWIVSAGANWEATTIPALKDIKDGEVCLLLAEIKQ